MPKETAAEVALGEWQYPKDKLTVSDARYGPAFAVGNLLEVRDADTKKKRQVLVGDINVLGGQCDDCSLFSSNDVVVRWKAVWRP